MFRRILVPLDGSEQSESIIPLAARLARAAGGTLVFVRVIIPPPPMAGYSIVQEIPHQPSAYEREVTQAEQYLSHHVAFTFANELIGIHIEMYVDAGAPASAIFSAARLEQVDLIVMCSHGEKGLKRWVFGSVAQQAVRHSPVPVLVLNESQTTIPPLAETDPLRVLVALDGSPYAETVILSAAQLIAALSHPYPGALHLLQVISLPDPYGVFRGPNAYDAAMVEEAKQEAEVYMRLLVERIRHELKAGFPVTVTSSVVVKPDIARTIIGVAEQIDSSDQYGPYHLIALATHGRSGIPRLLLGSVTEEVIGTTKLPVLVVRPHQGDAIEHVKTGEIHTRV